MHFSMQFFLNQIIPFEHIFQLEVWSFGIFQPLFSNKFVIIFSNQNLLAYYHKFIKLNKKREIYEFDLESKTNSKKFVYTFRGVISS